MQDRSMLRRAGALLLAVAVGALGTQAFAAQNESTHLPADKTAVAGSTKNKVGPNKEKPILQERMRVSTPSDLILGVTAECSILTSLHTHADNDTSTAQGKVSFRIEIDGKEVPVESSDPDGSVVFCNRTYSRTVTDDEDPLDGIDDQDDYIRTKHANAFNWLAFNVGTDYDKPENGDNIVDVVVYAKFVTRTDGDATAQATIGKRTLVIEPVKAAVNEVSEETDTDGSESLLPL